MGICNAHLNIGHVVGMFDDWPDYFRFGGTRNMSGKLSSEKQHGLGECPALLVVRVKLGGSILIDWYIDAVGKNHFDTFKTGLSEMEGSVLFYSEKPHVLENTKPSWYPCERWHGY